MNDAQSRRMTPWLLLLASSACSGPKDASPDSPGADSEVCETWQDPEEFASQFPAANCDWEVPCGFWEGDMQACLDFTEYYAGCYTHDPCLTRSCVDALRAMPDCGNENYPTVCNEAYLGELTCSR
ncbi:MAG: hypothetical protein H6740_26390 [Alphaproteobacteria bacterium]|nr:hypothetical protein [Alphaproteobacteria bacterium]